MSTRSAKVVLELLVDKYLQNAKKAADATKAVGEEAENAGKKTDKASEQASSELAKLAKAHQDAAKAAGLQYNSAGQLVDGNKRVLSSAQATAHGLDSFSDAVYKSGFEAEQASERQTRAAAKQAAAAEHIGTSLTVFGATSVAALGASTKAAMDWESAWAGVTKTIDGTPEQMAEVEAGLRGLAKTLPSTHEEIAGVAEAAGQLGVKREDVLAFTKTMVDLGETTNLTAEDAATAIAQIANVMGTQGDEIDNFGATLVALGNDGASTEKDILSMAQRIAGAGKLVGATEGEVLALSNTLASMGVQAELGGGVSTRALLKMYAAVQEGGPKLDAFAKAAGTSADDFAKAFRESPVEALNMVTQGMARTKDEGGNVVAIMKDMGLKGTEEMQVMLALAGAGDLLTESLDLQGKAWEENTALTDEANKRYETTASQVKVAWNNIKDAAIDAGAVLLPIVQGVAESVSGLAQTFGGLPKPVQDGITMLGGVVGVGALVAGTLMTVVPKVRDTVSAFKDLNTRADGSSRGMGKIAKTAGLATAGLVALNAAGSIGNQIFGKAEVTNTQFAQGLLSIADNTEKLDGLFKDGGLGTEINGVGDAIARWNDKVMFDDFSVWLGDVTGAGSKLNTIRDNLQGVDGALTSMVGGGKTKEAAAGFAAIAKAAEEQNVPVSKLVDMFPQYRDSLLETMNAAGQTNVTQEQLAEAMLKGITAADGVTGSLTDMGAAAGGVVPLTEEVVEQLEEIGLAADGSVSDIAKFTAALFNAGLLSLSASDSAIAYQASIDAMTESVIKNGTSLDLNTEQGRANQSAYNAIAKAAMSTAEATAAETLATQGSAAAQAQLQASLQTSYDDLVTAAGQLGITGDAADTMARKALGIPKEIPIETWVNDKATSELERIKGKADGLDGRQVNITIRETTYLHTERSESVSSGAGTNNSAQRTYHADGGEISGPGTSTSDEVPIMASAGEHMLDRGDVIKMGGQQAVYKFRASLKAGSFEGLAGGGAVGSHMASAQLMAFAPGPAPSVSLDGLAVYVTNPFTGEQVRGIVRTTAQQEASGAVARADSTARFTRKGRN